MKKLLEDPYIWEKPNALTDEFCDHLVQKFEDDPGNNMYRGIIGKGFADPDIKETFDLNISHSQCWKKEDNIVCTNIGELVNEYFDHVKESIPNSAANSGIFKISDTGYQIQRYLPNKGFYTWHNDYRFEKDYGSRILTFIYYLNTVDEGGETEFTNGIKIKAEKGKVVLFPSLWTYTHRGCIPYSGNKYILTGWLYNGWYKSYDEHQMELSPNG